MRIMRNLYNQDEQENEHRGFIIKEVRCRNININDFFYNIVIYNVVLFTALYIREFLITSGKIFFKSIT